MPALKQILRLLLPTLALLMGGVPSTAMAVEEPNYQVLISEPPFEVRRYPGFVIAETQLEGDFDAASRTGFRRVAGYIFGDNSAPSGGNKKIAMTAPVTVTPKDQGWKLHFVMPSAEQLESLPKPNNPDVTLRKIGAHEIVSIQFSGWTTTASIEENTAKLRTWAASKNLALATNFQVARYDDPFTLPWRRRNEILIEIVR